MKKTIEEYLPEHPFFADFDPEIIRLFAGCATNVHFTGGQSLFHEGDAADTFYLVRKGRVSISTHQPGTGGVVMDTAEAGDVVGWSWLVPPYRWMFDARAVKGTSAVAFDATCLRTKCSADPAVGYALLQKVTSVMLDRLEAARMRLVDMYAVKSP
jgi:CRP-like cAMP-binding protein